MKSFQRRAAITLILASAISLTLSGIWVYSLYQKVFSNNDEVIQTYQTIRAINRIVLSVNQAGMDLSSYLLTNDKKYMQKIPEAIILIQVNLATLYQLTQDNPSEIAMDKLLSAMINKKIEFLQATMKLDTIDKNAIQSDPVELTYNINQLIEKIRSVEIAQLQKAMPKYQSNTNIANKTFILLGSFNVLLVLLAFLFTRPLLNVYK